MHVESITKIANYCRQRYTGNVNRRIPFLAVILFLYLVGCQGATETPSPPTPRVIFVVATPVPTDTPPTTPFPTATVIPSPGLLTPTRTKTPTRAPATPTRPRPTATSGPTAAPADTLLDGNYSSSGSVRVDFTVSNGGTVASAGFFNYHCPVDGALSTYGFTDPASIVGGKFTFSALPTTLGVPRVSMVCTAVTLTQARCTIRNLLATNKCLDTPANASRK